MDTVDIPADPRLPVILLTGFLGAGKTTLLLRWLRESPMTGRRMGVVMNEFGQESVDSQLIDRPGLPLRQVAGGCVCCAPDNELDRACTQLAVSGECDYIVVETSGLADPDNVIDILTDQDLLPVVQLQAVVTVLDAEWYQRPEMESGERVLAKRQLQFAHVICLSRCDRIGDTAVAEVTTAVRAINPSAQIVRLPYGLPDPGELLRNEPGGRELTLSEPAAMDAGQPSGSDAAAHLHTEYLSLAFHLPVPVERSKFEAFLSTLNGREVVRAKGFVRFRAMPEKLYLFQSVWGTHLIEEFPARPQPAPVAVLIGPRLDLAKFRAALQSLCFDGRAARLPGLTPTQTTAASHPTE